MHLDRERLCKLKAPRCQKLASDLGRHTSITKHETEAASSPLKDEGREDDYLTSQLPDSLSTSACPKIGSEPKYPGDYYSRKRSMGIAAFIGGYARLSLLNCSVPVERVDTITSTVQGTRVKHTRGKHSFLNLTVTAERGVSFCSSDWCKKSFLLFGSRVQSLEEF